MIVIFPEKSACIPLIVGVSFLILGRTLGGFEDILKGGQCVPLKGNEKKHTRVGGKVCNLPTKQVSGP